MSQLSNSEPQILTGGLNSQSPDEYPAYSGDGRFIAYVSSIRGKADIFIYDRQTQISQLLTANVRGSVRHPTVTGDGRYVAFETSQLGQWHIAIVDRGSTFGKEGRGR